MCRVYSRRRPEQLAARRAARGPGRNVPAGEGGRGPLRGTVYLLIYNLFIYVISFCFVKLKLSLSKDLNFVF